jgi:hypothetical protein
LIYFIRHPELSTRHPELGSGSPGVLDYGFFGCHAEPESIRMFDLLKDCLLAALCASSFLFVLIQKETKKSRQTRWLRPFCRANARVWGGEDLFLRHPELDSGSPGVLDHGVWDCHPEFVEGFFTNSTICTFFSFCLDTKRNKKIKTNPMAPPVLSCQPTCVCGGG